MSTSTFQEFGGDCAQEAVSSYMVTDDTSNKRYVIRMEKDGEWSIQERSFWYSAETFFAVMKEKR